MGTVSRKQDREDAERKAALGQALAAAYRLGWEESERAAEAYVRAHPDPEDDPDLSDPVRVRHLFPLD